MKDKRSNVSASDRVYAYVAKRIVAGELESNTALGETQISGAVGASRTPVREALQRLANDGLVRIIPGRGAFVADFSVQDLRELYGMREALESFAARQVALSCRENCERVERLLEAHRRPWDFTSASEADEYYTLSSTLDRELIEMTGNARLAEALRKVHMQLERARHFAASQPARLAETVNEHLAMLEAMRAGDPGAASEATRQHVQNSLHHVLRKS